MKLTEDQIGQLVMKGISNADDASELILQMVRDITGEDEWMVSDDILLPLLRKLRLKRERIILLMPLKKASCLWEVLRRE